MNKNKINNKFIISIIKNKITNRYRDLDKLCYFLVVAFGLSFLMVTLYFQFGKTVLTIPNARVILDNGYITENRLWVRVMEFILSLGITTLGMERIINKNKNRQIENEILQDIVIKENKKEKEKLENKSEIESICKELSINK